MYNINRKDIFMITKKILNPLLILTLILQGASLYGMTRCMTRGITHYMRPFAKKSGNFFQGRHCSNSTEDKSLMSLAEIRYREMAESYKNLFEMQTKNNKLKKLVTFFGTTTAGLLVWLCIEKKWHIKAADIYDTLTNAISEKNKQSSNPDPLTIEEVPKKEHPQKTEPSTTQEIRK